MSRSVDRAAIDRVLRDAVDAGAVPHVAAIAADADGVFYEAGFGPCVAGQGGEVTASTEFAIMSMTKMVVTVAALQLVEQGSLDLDAPVDTYRPEFAELKVLAGFDGDTPRLRAPASRATVRHLITHTSGLAYWFWNEDIAQYEKVVGLPNVVPGRLDAFKAPMVAEPGTRFVYGINTSWLGRVVEAVTGKGLRRTAILQPPSPRSSRRPGSWNESSEEQRIRNLFERVETIEEVAVTLPQGDDRRTRLLALSRDALAEEATVRPVIAAKILGLSEKTVRAWADGGLLATTQRYPPTLP